MGGLASFESKINGICPNILRLQCEHDENKRWLGAAISDLLFFTDLNLMEWNSMRFVL